MPCAGRCDDPVPLLIGHETFVASGPFQTLQRRISSPLPVPNPGGREECVFAEIRRAGAGEPGGLQGQRGLRSLGRKLSQEESPIRGDRPAEGVEAGGPGGRRLPHRHEMAVCARGCGRAERAWYAMRMKANRAASKIGRLMDHDPFAVIEGMTLAGYAMGAATGIPVLALRIPRDQRTAGKRYRSSRRERPSRGGHILGSDFTFRLYLRRGAGAYICGEEGFAAQQPGGQAPLSPATARPIPLRTVLKSLPTAVNNVETLCAVPQILRRGAEWYQGLGLGDHAGTKVISLSGDVQRPGNYEVPFGLPLRTLLYDWAGGPLPGRCISGSNNGRDFGRISGQRGAGVGHVGRAEHSGERVSMLGAGGVIDFRRQPRYRGYRSPGDGVFCPRELRQMFPLPHRYTAPAGTAFGRRPQRA